MWWLAIPLVLALMGPASAETVVAARTIPAQTVLGPDDVGIVAGTVPGTARSRAEVVGLETRVVLYSGRPVRRADLGPPAIVDRNQEVMLVYAAGPLTIMTTGRALGRGGLGDRIKVMNLASRAVVAGLVAGDATVRVQAE